MKKILLLIIIFMFSCDEERRPTRDPYEPPSDRVTIMSWNVEQFLAQNPYINIASIVKRSKADILMISESQSESGEDEKTLATALSELKWPMPYHAYATYWDGLGVFSRYPIKSTAQVVYSSGPRNIYQVVILLPNNQEITLYGAHLKSGTDLYSFEKRLSQSSDLATYIRRYHDLSRDQVIILGDMNTMGTTPGEPNEDFEAGSTLDRLCLKDDDDPNNDFIPVNKTYLPEVDTHHWPSLLDHIILSPGAMVDYIENSISVLLTPWSGIYTYSDHRPVILQLSIK